MRNRATFVTTVAGSVVALGLSPFVMGGGCGSRVGDHAGIAAFYNATDDPLTIVAYGTTEDVTEVLEAGEAVLFEVRQSAEPYMFRLVQGVLARDVEFFLVTGGETPGFPTALMAVSVDDSGTRLTPGSFGGEARGFSGGSKFPLSRTSSMFLVINASQSDVGLQSLGRGSLLFPGRHTSIGIQQGETKTVDIEDLRGDASLLSHEFSPPDGVHDDVAAFLSFITIGPEGIEVEDLEAKYTRLE